MARDSARPVLVTEGSDPTFATQVRDALAIRLQRYEERYSDVLDLLTEILVAGHEEMHGHASALCGTLSPAHWREVWRGERDLSGRDFLRLFLSPHPKAQAAADRFLSILQGARAKAAAVGLNEALAQVHEAHGVLSAELLRDIGDGSFSPSEAADAAPEIAALEARLAKLKAVCTARAGEQA